MPKPAVKWLTWYFPALDNGNMLSYAACECSDYFRRLLLQLSPKYSLWLQIELSKTKYEDVSLNPRLHVVNNSVSNYRKNWRTSNRRTRVRYDCVTVLLSGKSLIFKVPFPKVVFCCVSTATGLGWYGWRFAIQCRTLLPPFLFKTRQLLGKSPYAS